MGPWIFRPRCGTVNASWMPNCNCKEHQQTLEENVMLKALLSEVRIADHLMRLGGRSELPAAVLRRLRACAHIKTEVEHG